MAKKLSVSLEDFVAPFRAMERNEDAVPILGDEDAVKCLAGWMRTDQRWEPPRGRAPALKHDNHAAVWAWITAGWQFDFPGIAVASGLSVQTVHAKVAMLVRNRLIYPDGSTSRPAKAAIGIYVAEKLGLKTTKEKTGKPKTDKGEPEAN